LVNGAIHRVIEQQAAMQPEAVALIDATHALTYRDLNQRANTLARRLADSGLRRGSIALVQMHRSVDLAVVLLAVLKAGAAYAWREPGTHGEPDLPSSFCIAQQRNAFSEQCFLAVDIRNALAACAARSSPNLPILTRGSDIACILPDSHGEPQVLVPHETIASLPAPARADGWTSEPGAFDLWIALMSGETLRVGDPGSGFGDRGPVPAATQAA
jgi:non-ribosomal peptide synthetase component F